MSQPLTGIVLAAGYGTRMQSRVPKVLFPLLGKPLLEYPLRLLEGVGCDPIVGVVGAGAEQVRASFANRDVHWALQSPPRGTGDAALVGLSALGYGGGTASRRSGAGDADELGERRALPASDGETVVILNGDLPLLRAETLKELLRVHEREGAALTLLTVERGNPRGYGRIERGPNGDILGVWEEADICGESRGAPRDVHEVNGGVYIANAGALYRGLRFLAAHSPANAQGELYLPPVIGPVRDSGGRIASWRLPAERQEELQQVNDRSELAEVTTVRRHQIVREHQLRGVTVVDPETTFIEEDVEIGKDTTIYPFCYIHRGVRLGDGCRIGPFTHLRYGADLESEVEIGNFTEVKETRMGKGSKAKHLSYLGDGQVGERVNIGAGTIFANYDGVRRNTTRIGDGAFVGSGTIFIAPVEVGEGARTGAGAVVPRGREIHAGQTVVGVPARPLPGRTRRAAPPRPERGDAPDPPVDREEERGESADAGK